MLYRIISPLLLCGFTTMTASCAGTSIYSTSHHHNSGLHASQLQQEGLAFLTPSTVTGQEEDKQALALVFGEVLTRLYPKVRSVSLPETLSAINRNALTDEYRTLYEHYRHTGIFRHESLRKIGQATGARYVAQLKLAGFEQGSAGRFGIFGWRMVDTKHTQIRLFMQIWDTQEGNIVWEATHEMNYSYDTVWENSVSFRRIVQASAQELLERLAPTDPAQLDAIAGEMRLSVP
jgi:hypothetical protein